jgi:uncharacterized damage-inducible protein DinB
MKKVFLLSSVIFAVGFSGPKTDSLSPSERKFAVDYYNKTKEHLLSDIKGLSPEQLNFKADSSRWSVAQCVEHIALAETAIWQWCQHMMQQPATPEKRSEMKFTPEQVIQRMTDRSSKFKAPDAIQPSGKFPSTEAATQAFISRRDSTITYIKMTQDDLKDHFIQHPVMGTLDLYEGLIIIAAHSARHTLQIEEVMANPNFPKH